jgi:hypothetical protein
MEMEIHGIIISPFLIVFSLGMLVTSIASYLRSKNIKLIFVSLVFLIFLIKGIVMAFALFFQELTVMTSISYFGILDLVVLILLFIATLKR